MNVGILKRYISIARTFWSTAVTKKLQASSSFPSPENPTHALVSFSDALTRESIFSKNEVKILAQSDIKILNYLDDLISNSSDVYRFNSVDLLTIGKIALSRMKDPLVSAFSEQDVEYKKKVFSVYMSMYQLVNLSLFNSIREIITQELPRLAISDNFRTNFTVSSESVAQELSFLGQPLSSSPLPASQSSFFSRSRSAHNLGDALHSSRQYMPGSGFPDLKRATQEFGDAKDPKSALIKFNHAVLESLLTLPANDSRQASYRRLQNLIQEKNRIMFSLEAKKVEHTKKANANQIFRLSDLNHFIYTLDSENTCLLSEMTSEEFSFLKKFLPKFTMSTGVLLSSRKLEECRRIEFDVTSYQNLKRELIELSSKRSTLLEQNKVKLRLFLHRYLSSSRALYLRHRLEGSLLERFGNRFLLNLEDEFRCIFASYIDSGLIDTISFHVEKRALFSGDSYAAMFCEKIFNTGVRLTLETKQKIRQMCVDKETELRSLYSANFSVLSQLIPARLSFEMVYVRALKNLRDSIVRDYTSLTENELKCFETHRNTLQKELLSGTAEKFLLDEKGFKELTEDDLQEILAIIKNREVALRTPWNAPDNTTITFHPTHYPHDPFNLYYIRFCRSIIHAINLRYASCGTQFDLIQGMFNVENKECPNMAYVKKFGFTYPDLMMKQSMVEFGQFCNTRSLSGVEFVVPELMAIYLNKDTYYTVLGLLLINDAKLCKETIQGKTYVTLDIPNLSAFRLLKTLDHDGQFRALTILEIGSFGVQEYRVKSTRTTSSFPLWVRGTESIKFYHSFQFLLSQLVIRSWHEIGKPDQSIILKLIELYLNKDPMLHHGNTQYWKKALAIWADDLIYTGQEENRRPRDRAYIYTLYGQVIDGEMYMFQLLYRLFKDEHSTDELMLRLTAWYLNKSQGDTKEDLQHRLMLLQQVFIKGFEHSNTKGQLYFNRSDTRYEKLARGLVLRQEIQSHRRFMIPGLRTDIETVYRGDIGEIPFEHALLSDDGTNIYDLRIVEMRFRETRQFINVVLDKPFTSKERSRIMANPLYTGYAIYIETIEEAAQRSQAQNNRLSSRMVKELWKLLDDTHLLEKEIAHELNIGHSVRHEGIKITPEMYRSSPSRCDELMQSILLKKIDRFIFDYYLSLSGSEKIRLDNYLIYLPDSGTTVPFLQLLRQFTDPTCRAKHFCLDKVTEPLFRVLLSYDKVSRFREWLEIIVYRGKSWLDDLRTSTPELEYSDNHNSPMLQKLKILLFRLKACANFSFCHEIEAKLNAVNFSEPVDDLRKLYHRLKADVKKEFTVVSTRISGFSLTNSYTIPPDLIKKRDTLRSVSESLNSAVALYDDERPYYNGEFLVSALHRCLDTWDTNDLPPKLRQVYRTLLKMAASRNAYLYSILPAEQKSESTVIALVRKYRDRGVDITKLDTIETAVTHMLEVNMNVQWCAYLESIDETHRTRLSNYLNRQSTHSNSFGL